MLLEHIIFTILAFGLFVDIFIKMIQKNDTTYVAILLLEAIGIAIMSVEMIFDILLNMLLKIVTYLLAIILPVLIIIMEKKNKSLLEIISVIKAKICLMFEDNKNAKSILIKLVTKYPNSYEGHKLLAEIYEKEGGMRKAIDEYVQVIDINKKDYDSYYKIANLLNDLDKKDEAAEMLSSLLSKKPEYIQASLLLGDILIDKGDYKEALNIYNESIKFDPTNFELNYSLGIVYTMLNDFQNARMYYEKAAELNSLVYNSKYSLAEIALIYKELEEAEKRFMEVLEDEELQADAYFELAKINMIKGEKDKAIKYANIAIESDSKKIVEKIKKDPIFIPILAKISMPITFETEENDENKKKKSKLTKKELKAKKQLEEMSEITRKLSYSDINLLKKTEDRKYEIKFKQNDIQKEREE